MEDIDDAWGTGVSTLGINSFPLCSCSISTSSDSFDIKEYTACWLKTSPPAVIIGLRAVAKYLGLISQSSRVLNKDVIFYLKGAKV